MSSENTEKSNKVFNAHILVVEDQPTNQQIIAEMLDLFGCTFDIVDDGLEGVKKFTEQTYDMVLLDILMPKMDGYETVRSMRSKEATAKHIPIIAVSANIFVDSEGEIPIHEVKECIDNGMDDFIAKPIRLDTLQTILERYLT